MTLRKLGAILVGAFAVQVLWAVPAAAYEWPEELREGSTGVHVKTLQTRVAGWFPARNQTLFEIDGNFDSDTTVAVKLFQEHYGLEPDGVAGEATFEALNMLESADKSTLHFEYAEFWQNRNSSCSAEANQNAGTFKGGMVGEARVIKNVRRLMWRLEALRAKIGDKPIAINSGFRSAAYNRCIRGATYSQHQYGTAVDMRVVQVTNRKGRNVAKGTQVHGIGCYSSLSHNHFDLRIHNDALGAAQYWWWPERDEFGRDLADDNKPCYGEVKHTGSVSGSDAATGSGGYDFRQWSEAELKEWKAAGEAPNLHGLD